LCVVSAESFDCGEDVVGRPDPAERLRVGVVVLDECGDVGAQGGDASVDAAADPALGDEGDEPLDLVQPGGGWSGCFASQSRMSGVLWMA
jgi:hypothetical protein